MAFVTPCIRGKMGNTVFYETTLPARELVTGVRIASDLDDWAILDIDERMQRDPKLKRIKEELGPYIANSEDRFFGSLIVLVYEGEVQFEDISTLAPKMPAAYKTVSKNMGYLTIDGGTLIVLDGQHRWIALSKVIQGEIGGKFAKDVTSDDVCVIFIKHETSIKTRRIFNKVNRYAKSTSKSDNLITSEDDVSAITARRLFDSEGPLGSSGRGEDSLVNWKQNTLSVRSTQLTTLGALYDTVKQILKYEGKNIDEHFRPDKDDLEECYQLAESYWRKVIDGLQPYQAAISNPSRIPQMREDRAQHSLLFKPAFQVAMFYGLIASMKLGLTLEEAVSHLSKLPLSMKDTIWRDIIIRRNGTIDTKTEARDKASSLIMYLIAADKMSQPEILKIKEMYNSARGNDDDLEELPEPVVSVAQEQ